MGNIADIHNYYEELVMQQIRALELDRTRDSEYLADLCCMVLNQLPAHYIRHNVDMVYFTTPEQRAEMEEKVFHAVNQSVSWLDSDHHDRRKQEEE